MFYQSTGARKIIDKSLLKMDRCLKTQLLCGIFEYCESGFNFWVYFLVASLN
jgi:hypothetical protein